MQGKFITLEGIDGVGKSTHLPFLFELLKQKNREVVMTREPGGTPLGEKLRALLLSEAMRPDTESLLMFAARSEHLAEVILPALARGAYVLSDRFTDASFAYQCGGRGISFERMRDLEHWVQHGFTPDLTLLLDIPIHISQKRLSSRQLDRFERESTDFSQRVRSAYLQRARAYPNHVYIIDADDTVENIQARIKKIIEQKL